MRAVTPHLFLGNALDARDVRRLYELEIAAVIDLAVNEPPAQLGREIVYCRFPLVDGAGNSDWLLQVAIETTSRFVQRGVKTLVACSGGMSRSPAIVAAALAFQKGESPDDCLLDLVAGRPHDVSPLLWQDVKRMVLTASTPKTPSTTPLSADVPRR
jgi:protein-tyrosine phosphatase